MPSRTASRVVTAAILAIALSAATAASASAARTLTLTPVSSDLGSVALGDNSAPQFLKLTVGCTPAPCSDTFNPAPTAGSSEFPVLNLCPVTIDVNQFGFFENPSCYIVASFAPAAAGVRSATLSTGPGGPTATLTGTGVAPAAAPATQATAGKCKKGDKKKGRAAKKCKRKTKR